MLCCHLSVIDLLVGDASGILMTWSCINGRRGEKWNTIGIHQRLSSILKMRWKELLTHNCNQTGNLRRLYMTSPWQSEGMDSDLLNLSLPTWTVGDSHLADSLFDFAFYIMSRNNLVKTKKNMPNILMDINKGAISK